VNTELVLALASGIAISAACGLRAFLPLFALGLAARFAHLELHPGVVWLASTPALVCFGFATVLEIAADKIPVVDHALDVVGSVIRPVAGWLAGYAVLAHWPAPWAQIVALILGGGALAVQAAKAKVRLGTTAITLGHGNPIVSAAEDVTATLLLVAALLAPLLALVLVVVLVSALARRSRRTAEAAAGR